MAQYNITATRIENYTITVEANSKDEAIAIAEEREVIEFDIVGQEFTIDYADEIK